jgi:hypothetical protein
MRKPLTEQEIVDRAARWATRLFKIKVFVLLVALVTALWWVLK